MKLFVDTGNIKDIEALAQIGIIDGVTTNPSLFAKVGGSYDEVLKQICEITPGPVSAEVVAADVDGMLHEGHHFAALAPNIGVLIAARIFQGVGGAVFPLAFGILRDEYPAVRCSCHEQRPGTG